MGNPNLVGNNDHNITTASEWDSLMNQGVVSRADLPAPEIEEGRAPGYSDLDEDRIKKNETSLNSKTGKERTFSDMDLYARRKITDEDGNERYETAQEQGEYRKERNDMITWTELISYDDFRKKYGRDKTSAILNKVYTDLIKSLVEKYPREEGESLADYKKRAKGIVDSMSEVSPEPLDKQTETDRLKEKLANAVKAKKISEKHAEKLAEKYVDRYVEEKVQRQEGGEKRFDREAMVEELLHPEGFEGDMFEQAEELVEKTQLEALKRAKEAKEQNEDIVKAKEKSSEMPKLDPEIQRWYDDRMGDVLYGGYKYREGEKERLIELIRSDAINMQAAADREKAAAEKHEATAAEEREAAAAKEREAAAAEERAKAKALEEIQAMIGEGDEILDGNSADKPNRGPEETRKKIEEVNDELRKLDEMEKIVKSGKKPGFALWIASFFAKIIHPKEKSKKVPEKTEDDEPIHIEPLEEAEDNKNENPLEEDREFHFWSSIDEEGVEIMGDNKPLTEEKTEAIGKWWDSLDEETRDGVTRNKEYIGRALFTFLQNNGVIAEDAKGFFGGSEEDHIAKDRVEYLKESYHYWNSIGGDGVGYLTGRIQPNEENADRIVRWWNSLDDAVKAKVKEENSSFINGSSLSDFLRSRPDAVL